jgi:hypothetical protein
LDHAAADPGIAGSVEALFPPPRTALDWRDIGRRHPAPGRLKDLRDEHLTYSALALAFSADW